MVFQDLRNQVATFRNVHAAIFQKLLGQYKFPLWHSPNLHLPTFRKFSLCILPSVLPSVNLLSRPTNPEEADDTIGR